MEPYLLPRPKTYQRNPGSFTISAGTRIRLHTTPAVPVRPSVTGILAECVARYCGYTPAIHSDAADISPGDITLLIEEGHSLESYRIDITPDRAVLAAGTPRGLMNAVRTCEQLLSQTAPVLPCLHIGDSPDFTYRGFYHDVSRGKVPTLDTMKLIVDTASRYKLNQVQFYVEHVFAFQSHPDIWEGNDVITPDDIRELDRYACDRYLNLVPSLASFGHMYDILQHPNYRHLRELEDFDPSESSLWWNRMVHHTIDVSNEESYRLLGDLFDDYLPCFSSAYFNMCCDETVDLGQGRNRERAEREGVGELYLGHVLRLYDMVKRHGKRPMIWGDIVLKHPELLDRLPDDIIVLNWEYGAEVNDDQTALFAEKRPGFFNCPGVWGWSKFMNRFDTACGNIRRMIDHGRRHGAAGILNTDWGDFGHVNPLSGSLHGLAYGAALSWHAGSISDGEFDAAYSRLTYGDDGETVAAMRELGTLYTFWRRMLLGIENLTQHELDRFSLTDPCLGQSCRTGTSLAERFAHLSEQAPSETSIDYTEFRWAARAVAANARLALLFRRRILGRDSSDDSPMYTRLADDIAALSRSFADTWLVRNKPSELFRIQEVFDRLEDELRRLGGR